MLKRPHYVALIIVTLIALVVLNLPGGAVARLRFAFNGFFLPLFGFAATSQNLAGQAGDLLVPRRELIRENQQLRRDNQQLQLVATQAVEIARGGGKILLVGVYEDPLTWQPLPVIGKNLTLIGCLGGNFRAVIELFKEGKVNTKGMITHRFSLDEAATAFRTQLEDPAAVKVMIKP